MRLEPGLYDDLSFIDYLKIEAMNFHTLKELDISALHLKHVFDGYRQPSTDALRLGRAIHCGVLTPKLFATDHPVSPGCAAPMKSGARKGLACGKSARWSEDGSTFYCGTHAKGDDLLVEFDNVLTEAEGHNIASVVESVLHHPAGACLLKEGKPEQTIVFERHGVLCKARVDWLMDGHFVDLKKLQRGKADDRSLLQAIVKYSYYQQLAFYAAAVMSIQGEMPAADLLFCEDAPPYDVTLLPFDEQSLLIGLAEMDQLLKRYKRHRADGNWPGVFADAISIETGQVKRGGLPKWYRDEAVASGLVAEDTWPTEALRGIDAPPALTGATVR